MAEPTANIKTSEPQEAQGQSAAQLFHMSTTAGLTGGEGYVAVNTLSVVALIMGLASVLCLFFGEILLVIPLAAIVLAIVAIRQVSDSNGTQMGKPMAYLGILLSLGFAAFVFMPGLLKNTRLKPEREAIEALMVRFGELVREQKSDELYSLCTPKFQARVTPKQFAAVMRMYNSFEMLGKVVKSESNGNINLLDGNSEIEMMAEGMAKVTFEKSAGDAARIDRLGMRFERIDGKWLIHEIPTYFPYDVYPPPGAKNTTPGNAPAGPASPG